MIDLQGYVGASQCRSNSRRESARTAECSAACHDAVCCGAVCNERIDGTVSPVTGVCADDDSRRSSKRVLALA